MIKILFVCSASIDRSPTAEHIYANQENLEVKSAGVSWYAQVRVSTELLQWADVVLCMEEWQKKSIEGKYPDVISNKKIDYLNIPDYFQYKNPQLIDLIKEKVDRWLFEYTGSK